VALDMMPYWAQKHHMRLILIAHISNQSAILLHYVGYTAMAIYAKANISRKLKGLY